MENLFEAGAGMDKDTLPLEFARTFSSASGRRALEYLKSITLNRYLPPSASDAELRYLEGQRYLVSFIMNMARRGTKG